MKAVLLIALIALLAGCIGQSAVPEMPAETAQPPTENESPSESPVAEQPHVIEAKRSFAFNVWINESSGEGLSYFTPNSILDIARGMELWNTATGLPIFRRAASFSELDVSKGDIAVEFTPLSNKYEAWGWWAPSERKIYMAPSLLSCYWNIAGHEFGHVLGFDDIQPGSFENQTDIMFYSQYDICGREIKGYEIEELQERFAELKT
jgi:hypothetical protein